MSSSAGALTRIHSLADVERPEDLPPEIAEELARIVAEEPRSVVRWLRRMAPRAAIGALAAGGLVLLNPTFPGIVALAVLATGEPPWRRQTLLLLDERMRELGLSRRARARIRARMIELTGDPPRSDPAERPSAARLLEHLAPQRDRLGGGLAPPRMTALERRRDDLRLAALGYLRQSKAAVIGGWTFGSLTVAGGISMLNAAWNIVQVGSGVLFMAAGAGILVGVSLASHGSMRRAVPHVRMSLRHSLRLWKRVRRAAKEVDRSMPDTTRAQMIVELLLAEEDDEGRATPAEPRS